MNLDDYAFDVLREISKTNNDKGLLNFIMHMIKLSNLIQFNTTVRNSNLEEELVKRLIHKTPYKLVLK